MLTVQNAQAYGVLATIAAIRDGLDDFFIESYLNGRESGFALRKKLGGRKKAVFSENRNSDAIVLYTGTILEFGMNNSLDADRIYDERLYFPPYGYKAAADAVLAYLEDE